MFELHHSVSNVLVTGGCGFIGSNVINLLLTAYPHMHVCNVDKLDYNSSTENVDPCDRYTFVHGNICDENLVLSLLRKYHVEVVLHFAAQSHVDRSFVDPEQFLQDNVMGTLALLQAARKYGALRRFLHFSTDEIYGDNPDCQSFDETSPAQPHQPLLGLQGRGGDAGAVLLPCLPRPRADRPLQ